MAVPPVFAASALYDNLLQAALRQFFSRATFETEPIPSLSSDGRLAIEPTNDPSVLSMRNARHSRYGCTCWAWPTGIFQPFPSTVDPA